MSFVYESKLRKDDIVYDKEVGLQHEIEQTFQSPPVKRSHNYSSPRSSPDSNQCCCSCLEIIGGRLYNCSRCNSSFHSICHFPALPINKGSLSSSDWLCHRCETEIQYNRRHLSRIKCNSDFQEKEDALNQLLVRFLLRLSGKDGSPSEDFSEFVNSLKAINSREFSLDKLCVDECFYKLPFDEILANEEPSTKKCFYCKRFVKNKMISCDFCDASFCLDCPNPPFTALPNERFMCSLHIEPFIDVNLLNSKRVTDRMDLWKKHNELPKSNSTTFWPVVSSFFKKLKEENAMQLPKLESFATKMRPEALKTNFKIDCLVKRAYAIAEQRSEEWRKSREETPIDVGGPDDARLSIAVEALMNMHNQLDDIDQNGDSNHYFTASDTQFVDDDSDFSEVFVPEMKEDDQSLPCSFNPTLFDRMSPIFATLQILSGADKNVKESDFLIPIHSFFVTLGPLKVNSLHHIDLSHFTHCKMLECHQAVIFFDKAKLCFEIVSASLFDDNAFPSDKYSHNQNDVSRFVSECSCQEMGVGDESVLRLMDSTHEVVPSRKSAVLWNGAIIRIGCLRLHFVGLGIL